MTESTASGSGPHILVLSHGSLADALLAAAERINGVQPRLKALSLGWDESVEECEARLREAVGRLHAMGEVLILTDMYGGTPYNLARKLVRPGEVELVSGVNLPMVLRLSCMTESPLPISEMAEWIREKGRKSICRSDNGRTSGTDASPAAGEQDR